MPKLSVITSLLGVVSISNASLVNLKRRQLSNIGSVPDCPSGDGKQFVSPGGNVYQLSCDKDFDTSKGTLVKNLSTVKDLSTCMNECGSTFAPDCHAFMLNSKGCNLYKSLSGSGSKVLLSGSPKSSSDATGV